MGFQDLSEFLKPGLTLPIRGKNYTIPAPSAQEGLRLRLLMADPSTSFTNEGELEEVMKLLGAQWVPNMVDVDIIDETTGLPLLVNDPEDPARHGQIATRPIDAGTYKGGVWDEMCDDDLTWDEIMHAGRTALFDVGQGRALAEAIWTFTGDGSGNPLPPKPQNFGGQTGNRKTRRKSKGKKKR